MKMFLRLIIYFFDTWHNTWYMIAINHANSY